MYGKKGLSCYQALRIIFLLNLRISNCECGLLIRRQAGF